MSIATEFYQMAKEMLDDPEIGCDASVTIKIQNPNKDKPWEPTIIDQHVPLRVFYTKAKNGMVNGSVVLAGEKVCIAYPPIGISLEHLQTCAFIDHTGRKGVITAVEPVTVGNQTVIVYIKVGS